MVPTLPDILLSRLSAFVRTHLGLSFPKPRWGDLERGLQHAALDLGFPDAGACARSLMASSLSQSQIEVLAGHLTVTETYFFREPATLRVAETIILPELVRQRRGSDQRLRIWSAGCSSGEEPYTIAIMLHRLLPDLKEWHITVLGTDINFNALQKARGGIYGSWSFRGTPQSVRERYFRPAPNGRFEIVPEIRQMVSFAFLNLARDSYPSLATNTNAMDIIFCRNVLMYFDGQVAQEVAGKLYRSVVDGGWLLLSPAEASQTDFGEFRAVYFPEATVYRKGLVASPRAAGFPHVQQFSASPAPAAAIPEVAPAPHPLERGEAMKAGDAAGELERAALHYRQGRYPQAAEMLRALLDAQKTVQGFALLVRCYANQGELELALQWCERALASYKLSPELHYLHAVIMQEQDNLVEARAALQRTLYLDPGFILAHFALGNLAHREGAGKGERHLRNALALLSTLPAEAPLPEGEGMTAGRLQEIIRAMVQK